MTDGEAEGGCLCGEVRYRVTGTPVARTLCHCVSCRRATGGVSVAWAVFAKDDFTLLTGEVREYSSSPGIYWGFCPTCSSLVTYRRDTRPDHHDITAATLDDPNAFPPTAEIWVGEKIAWETLDPSLPHKLRSTLNE